MNYFCDAHLKSIKPNSKYSLFKEKSFHELDICKHIILFQKDIDKDDVDEASYLYIIEHKKKFE